MGQSRRVALCMGSTVDLVFLVCSVLCSLCGAAHIPADSYVVRFGARPFQPRSWLLAPDECAQEELSGDPPVGPSRYLRFELPAGASNELYNEQRAVLDAALFFFESPPSSFASRNGSDPGRQTRFRSFDARYQRTCTVPIDDSLSATLRAVSIRIVSAPRSVVDGSTHLAATCRVQAPPDEGFLAGYTLRVEYEAFWGWMGYCFTRIASCEVQPLFEDAMPNAFVEQWEVRGTFVDNVAGVEAAELALAYLAVVAVTCCTTCFVVFCVCCAMKRLCMSRARVGLSVAHPRRE